MMPTADHVAIAIIAACRETGAKPEDVAGRVTARGGVKSDYAVPRARAYAALALRAVFDGVKQSAIARMVGFPPTTTGALAQIDSQHRHNLLRWWSDDAFMRVVDALDVLASKKIATFAEPAAVVRSTPLAPKPPIRLLTEIPAPVRGPLGTDVTAALLGDRPPGRPRAEEIRSGRHLPRDDDV